MKRLSACLAAGWLLCAPWAAHAGGKSGVDGTIDVTVVGANGAVASSNANGQATMANSAPVVLASDQSGSLALSTVTPCATATTASCGLAAELQRLDADINTLNTTAGAPLAAGTNVIGHVINDANAGVNIGTVGLAANSAVALPAVTTGGATPYHFISTAATNATLISTGAHTLYSLTMSGLNTVAGYVRIYDSAGAPTCSSATGAAHSYLVIGSATQQGGLVVPLPAEGELYANGLSFCITGGSADTDNTSGPAGILVNASYK